MNTELFIARRILSDKENSRSFSQSIVKVAVAGIALGMAVMIISVAIVTGFKIQVRNKVIGFGAHILITNHDTNSSYEMQPINKDMDFYPSMSQNKGIKHIQVFATKPGIIKTETDIQGVVIKGVGSDYAWDFFERNLVEGKVFKSGDGEKNNRMLISKYLSNLLKIRVNDTIAMYFIHEQKQPRARKFIVSGIYETSLEEFDQAWVVADIEQVQKLNEWTKNQISGFEVIIDDFNQLDAMTQKVNTIAGTRFFDDGSKLRVRNVEELNPQIFDWLRLSDTNVWVILTLMVTVAGFNMVSGLLILILERTNMIGLLKAFGYSNVRLRNIFLYIATFLIGKGMLWGNFMGISLCIIQYYFGVIKLDPASYYVATVPINLKITHLILLNIAAMLVTLLMLLAPSFFVARIKPINAIRFN